jgi:hypothetical protein
MRRSNWPPSIVPRGDDHDFYLVVDDLGRVGRVWREFDYEATDFERNRPVPNFRDCGLG